MNNMDSITSVVDKKDLKSEISSMIFDGSIDCEDGFVVIVRKLRGGSKKKTYFVEYMNLDGFKTVIKECIGD